VAVLRAFSAVAVPLVPCIAIAGVVMSQTLLTESAQWQTPYAALLITKMILFLLLLGLAAWNRWRALPALAGADSGETGRGLRRSIAVEYGLILGVFAVTAVMTTFYSP
jgi:putative copper export protein